MPDLSDVANNIEDEFNLSPDLPSEIPGIGVCSSDEFLNLPNEREISAERWYKTYPYKFVVQQNDEDFFTYCLPIPPEQLIVKPVYASDAIPTIGGVVEESSAVTFWQIAMSGLMPHSVNREDSMKTAKEFRDTISSTGMLLGIASAITRPFENGIATVASLRGADGFIDGVQSAVLPHLPYSSSAVNSTDKNNGYSEIHIMQKFFLAYEYIKSNQTNTDGQKYTLYFDNYKDNQRFRVIPKQTDFLKTAKTPYGYRYQITLQGWDLRPVGSAEDIDESESNRFKNDLKTVNTLTVTQMITKTTSMIKNINTFRTGDLSTFISVPKVL